MRPDQEELFRRAISLTRRIDFLLLREFRDGLQFAGPARGPEHGLQESDVPVDRCAFGSVLLARLDVSADRGLRDGRDLPGGEELVQVDHDRLREMREEKKLSQGDIEKRTGLLRCYISRVENGHTVPAIETLEKMARALECPLYQLFYEGGEPPKLPNLLKRKSSDEIVWGSTGKEARYLNKFRRLLGKTEESDRKLLLYMAQKMANR